MKDHLFIFLLWYQSANDLAGCLFEEGARIREREAPQPQTAFADSVLIIPTMVEVNTALSRNAAICTLVALGG